MPSVSWQIESQGPEVPSRTRMNDCVIVGGSSHPELVDRICQTLDVKPAHIDSKIFSNGETRAQVKESVRDKHVFIIQSSHGPVNDYLMELLIIISALKIASAKSVTAVLPIFPYSRQLDTSSAIKKAKGFACDSDFNLASRLDERSNARGELSHTPGSQSSNDNPNGNHWNASQTTEKLINYAKLPGVNPNEVDTVSPRKAAMFGEEVRPRLSSSQGAERDHRKGSSFLSENTHKSGQYRDTSFDPHTIGMRKWIAQGGSLIASLLSTAGTDHVITMDLHDPQYQGFFDVPFDNLLFRPLLIEYIQTFIPAYHSAVIVSPDAGGAKRATRVADQLHMRFALIHQDRRNNATLLVGDVNDRVAIVIDDLIDSGKTVIRAARILKDHGAIKVVVICTHGLFAGETIVKIRDSAIDSMVTTNSVPQDAHQAVLGDRIHIVDVSLLFAEAIRRVHNGESLSRLYSQAPTAV